MQSLLGFLPLADHVIDRRRTILVGERDVEVYKKIQQELSTGVQQQRRQGQSKRKTAEGRAQEGVRKDDETLRNPGSEDLIGIGGRGDRSHDRSQTHEGISARTDSGGLQEVDDKRFDESSQEVVPEETEENLALLKKATVFAKDGYVVHPNNGAAMASVWVPRGWRCDEVHPSWNTTVLQFKPSQDALEMAARVGTEETAIKGQKSEKQSAKKSKGGKGTFDRREESRTNFATVDSSVPNAIASRNSDGSVSGSSVFSRLFTPETFISPVAAADPVACLRLTIQDLHAEVGEQTAAEYVVDVVSAIYRDQTRFVASKYKVNGPKILIDQPLQGKAKGSHHGGDNGGGGSDTGGATTTTDDEDFSFARYQRMFSSSSSKSAKNPPILLSGSCASAAGAAAAAISPSSAFSSGNMTKYVPPRIGCFSHILSYTTSTVIGQRTDKPRRVQVCSTSVVAVKDRFVYSLELQSSPPNHAMSCRAAPSSSSKEEFDDPSLASSSWMAAFLQMAQVMSFRVDTEADQSKGESSSNNRGGDGHGNESEDETRDTNCTNRSQQRPPAPANTRHGAASSRDTSSSATSRLPKGTNVLRRLLTSEPHCSIEVFLEEAEAEAEVKKNELDGPSSPSSCPKRCAALYFACETPPLWTPSLMNPNPLTSSTARGASGESPNRAVFRPMECSSADAAAALCVGKEQDTTTPRTGTVVVPLISFETNSEAFPARVEVYVSRLRTLVTSSQFETDRENQEAQLSKTAFAETIAALDLQRSYTAPAQTLQLPRHGGGVEDCQQRWSNGSSVTTTNQKEATPCWGGDLVTITPCQETVRPNPFALAMGVKPSASLGALSGRRVAMRPLATTRLHSSSSSVAEEDGSSTATPPPPPLTMVERFSIMAVEVPLRRNVMKCPAADLARVVGSVAFPSVVVNNKSEEKSLSALLDAIASKALSNQNTVLLLLLQGEEEQWRRARFALPHHYLNLTLDRRLVIPSLGIALSVGDACQCLATSLRPETASIAIRPCQPYADSDVLEDHSKTANDNGDASPLLFFVRKRNAKDNMAVQSAVSNVVGKADAANGTTNAEMAAVEDEGLITIETNFDADPKPEPLSSRGIRARAVLRRASLNQHKQVVPVKGKDMTAALASSVAELACELAEEEEGLSLSTDEVVIADWLAMVGRQRQGVIRHEWRRGSTGDKAGELKMITAGTSHSEGGSILPRLFFRVCSGGPDVAKSSFLPGAMVSPVSESMVNGQPSAVIKKEYAALQAHLRSATDASNGVFVSLESVCDVATARGVVIKAVSPTFSLYKKHRAHIMDLIFPSVEFY